MDGRVKESASVFEIVEQGTHIVLSAFSTNAQKASFAYADDSASKERFFFFHPLIQTISF